MAPFGRILILWGLTAVAIGVVLMFADKLPLGKFPLGRLPGDISFRKDNVQFYIPITTSIIISVLLSAMFWLISFLKRK